MQINKVKSEFFDVNTTNYTKRINVSADQTDLSNSATSYYTFAFVLNEWLEVNSVSNRKSTEDKYRRLINQHIIPELGNLSIAEITTEKINAFINKKLSNGRLDNAGGLSHSYVRTISIIIKSALNYSVEKNYRLPLSHLKIYMPKPEKKEYRILSNNSYQVLSDYLTTNVCPVNLGILLSLYAGLRIGEVCALRWKNINIAARIIHITSTITRINNSQDNISSKTIFKIDCTKTNAGIRNIPIVSNLIAPIEQLENKDSCFILTGTEDFMNPRTFENKFHKILMNCGIEQINYHILRHTFATRCIQKGVDVKTLSEFLGHADITTTLKTYVHSTLEQKLIEIEKISL